MVPYLRMMYNFSGAANKLIAFILVSGHVIAIAHPADFHTIHICLHPLDSSMSSIFSICI